ncbi:MAG: ABC transporter permease [Candidatus Bipolaricaulis sp.]|nr:ABC transporter permease [Candidatus Bipolaricaulis sp.]
MYRYLLRRLMTLALSLIVISILIFVVMRIIPGDPAQIILGTDADENSLAVLRDKLGLTGPIYVQYVRWVQGVLTGRLGESVRYREPISQLIVSRFAVTGPLAVMAMLFAVAAGIPAAVYSAYRKNKLGDYLLMMFSQVGLAVPAFWMGILLMLVFGVRLGWLPAGGFIPWSESFLGAVKSLLLPAVALGLICAASIARLGRSALLNVMAQDYIRTARSKGISERSVLYRHALRNALIPLGTVIGMQFASLLAGTIVIESVFYLPGLGRFAFMAIGMRDLPVVQDIVLFITALIVVTNFLVDVSYALLDPRIRLE